MAVAFDAVGPSSAGTSATAATSLSWSHTCGASATYLIVGVAVGNSSSTGTVSCTYNGVAMTNLGLQATNNTTAGYVVMFGLANPGTGSALTVAFTTSTSGTLSGGSMSFTGAGGVGTAVKNFGQSTSCSGTVTGVASTSMVAVVNCTGSGAGATATGTLRWEKNTDNNSGAGNGAAATNTGTGSVGASWTIVSDFWGTVAVEVNQSGATNPGPAPLTITPPGMLSPGGEFHPFWPTGPNTVIPSQPVAAGNAAGSGQAGDATVTVAPVAGNGSGTGAAQTATPNVAPNAGNPTGTGAAQDAVPNIGPAAGNAAGAGTAADATVTASSNASAGSASGTGAAPAGAANVGPAGGNAAGVGAGNDAVPNVGVAAGVAAGTAAANAATVSAAVTAGLGSGTGTAYDATALTVVAAVDPPPLFAPPPGRVAPGGRWQPFLGDTSTIAATPGSAAGTGTAQPAAVNVGASAGLASGSGAAGDAAGSVLVSATAAAGTGAAAAAVLTVSPTAVAAAGVGAAQDAAASVQTATGNAAGTGAAPTPTPNVEPNAGVASGTGTAQPPTITAASNASAGVASGAGTASAPTPNVGPNPSVAAGTGAAGDTTGSASTAAGVATGAGLAFDASSGATFDPPPLFAPSPGRISPSGRFTPFVGNVQASTDASPAAGAASGVGAAQQPTVNIQAAAATGSGSGAANAPAAAVSGTAGNSSGTGTAQPPVPNVESNASNAAGTGSAGAPTAAVTATPGVAAGSGTAQAPTPNVEPNAGLAAGTGAARDASASTSGSQNAAAGNASATGAAGAPSSAIAAATTAATGAGAARDATASASASAGVASGSAAALAPSPRGDSHATAGVATGVGASRDATTSGPVQDGQTSPAAATGAAAAHNPTILVGPRPTTARALAAAQHPRTATSIGGLLVRPGHTPFPSTTVPTIHRVVLVHEAPGGGAQIRAQHPGYRATSPFIAVSHQRSVSASAQPDTGSGVGAVLAARTAVAAAAGLATGTGRAYQPVFPPPVPVYAATGTRLSGATATSASIPVPAGVADTSIIVVAIFRNLGSDLGYTSTPAGFTLATHSPGLASGAHTLKMDVFWKRATGPDAGTYDFVWDSGTPVFRVGFASRIENCVPTGDPFEADSGAASTTSATTTPAVNVTTTGANRLLIWVAGSWTTGAWTMPTGFTQRVSDVDFDLLTLGSLLEPDPLSTGPVTGSQPFGFDAKAAWVGAFAPVDITGGTTNAPAGVSTGSGSAYGPTVITSAAPNSPPLGTRFSTGQDLATLDGPSSAPGGAVTVNPGTDLNTVTQANPGGTVFYLTAGTHTFTSAGAFSQVVPKAGNTYIGAPGAKLDGQNIAQYAFTGSASGVTIQYLEVMNFVCPFDEFTINHNAADNWTIQYCQVHHCGGAGIGIGTGTSISYSWLHHNRQYAVSSFKNAVADGATSSITSVTVDHCEISHCGDPLDEYNPDGTPTYHGRNGNCKFWDTSGITFSNSWMHHSDGVGLWADTNNIAALVSGNLFEDNSRVAFFYEISYNFQVRDNTFRRNNLVGGLHNNLVGDSFPAPAVYISESGGDSRVSGTYAGATIQGNAFVNNWDDIALWENADRFCNSPANTSSKVYKPRNGGASLAVCNNPVAKTLTVTLTSGSPNFTVTAGTLEYTDEGRPASGTGIPAAATIKEPQTANGFTGGYISSSSGVLSANATTTGTVTMTLAAGTINTNPAFEACRWHTQNITVQSNTFDHNRTEILGARNTANANPLVTSGRMAVFSQYGTFPTWSPYQATTIQDVIATAQNNVWQANLYRGPYRFLGKDTNNQFGFSTWQASPYGQDVGSSLTSAPQSGNGGGNIYVPDPPTTVTAVAGDGQAQVGFVPPVDDGGDTLIGYTVTASPGGVTASAASGPITVGGLSNGTAYTFTVAARTTLGPGAASAASNAVTPASGAGAFGNSVPWQPQRVSALRRTATTAYVAFQPPVSNGGAAITGYTAAATDASNNTISATGTSSPITITGLTGGTLYTYTVTATNTAGTGPASQPVPRGGGL